MNINVEPLNIDLASMTQPWLWQSTRTLMRYGGVLFAGEAGSPRRHRYRAGKTNRANCEEANLSSMWKCANLSGRFTEILVAHEANRRRREASERRMIEVKDAASREHLFSDPALTIFVAGSIGREEIGTRSDFDPFVVSMKSFDDSEQDGLIAALNNVSHRLGFEAPTREFLKIYEVGSILRNTGSPKDDEENCFTTRMLLLLESLPIVNRETYLQARDQVLSQYFRDERGKSSYRPLFLLNDILRYWRTLCLNYEALRHDAAKPWWKKNVNLKFSRLLTVFATVATLTVEEIHAKIDFLPICSLTPIRRFARALDSLDDIALRAEFETFLNDYESFLEWKERDDIATMADDPKFKSQVRATADRTSNFVFRVLMHTKIPEERRKFLVI